MAEGGQQNWRDGKTLKQCNRYMLEQEISCDVHFIVGKDDDQQRIGAHKYMLITRSEVFFAMFDGPLAEQNSLIQIPDIDPATFKKMLLYIYCDDTTVDLTEAFPLLYAAQKYNIQGLVTRCGQRMRSGISTETVCHILTNTILWHEEETKQACMQYINLHATGVFSTEGFMELEEESLIELLHNHDLNIQEEKIFEAVLKWGEEKLRKQNLEVSGVNRRKVLEKILPHIRFARMDLTYFSDNVSHKGILTQTEIIRWFQFLTTRRADPPEPPREQRLVFERFKRVKSGKAYSRGNSDAISFKLSEDVRLHEVLVYGSCMNQALYNMKLRVKEEVEEVYLKVYGLRTNGSTKTFSLRIIPPVLVKRDVCYSLVMEVMGPASYYGENGVENITNDGVTITFYPNIEGLNGTNIKQGQFHCLVFEKIQSH